MAHIRDRGKGHERRWQARYRDPAGREKSKTFTRKIDAQRWLDEVTADLVTGRYVDPRAGRVTLDVFARRWLDAQTFDDSTREATERRLRLHILPVLGDLELRHLRPSTVQAWMRSREESAPSSVRIMLVNLSAILSAAVEDGLIASNPCQSPSVKTPSVERRRVVPWLPEMVSAVVEAHALEFRAVPALGAGCGLRQGEIFGLRVDDVDFLRRRILVRHQVKVIDNQPVLAAPKGKREREVPLPDVVAVELAEHLRRTGTSDQVFTWRDGGLIHRTYYNNGVWKPVLRAADIEASRENGMHALRHHYASMLLEGGVSIRALADYLGHADPGFTLRTYAHLMPDSEDRARAVVDASFRAPAESSRNEEFENERAPN
jgi:integrase